jgi:hypothetical protein
VRHIALSAAAEVLDITEGELRRALRDGSSIADVAGDRGVEVEIVIDALVADATARIDEAVARGALDPERAAELKEALPERIDRFVNRERPRGAGRR